MGTAAVVSVRQKVETGSRGATTPVMNRVTGPVGASGCFVDNGRSALTKSADVPEGHSIHRQARDQTPMLARKVLAVSSPQGRFIEGAALLDGRRCTGVEACGKHLFYRFAGGDTLHIHLGLFGKFRSVALPAAEPRGLVRVRAARGVL